MFKHEPGPKWSVLPSQEIASNQFWHSRRVVWMSMASSTTKWHSSRLSRSEQRRYTQSMVFGHARRAKDLSSLLCLATEP